MHQFLLDALKQNQVVAPDGKEYVMNHIFQAALDGGMSMEAVVFDSGYVHDVGAPGDLLAAQREHLQ